MTVLPLALSGLGYVLLFICVPFVALAAYWAYLRIVGPRFVDVHNALLVDDAPATVITRARGVASKSRRYTYRRVGDNRLEIVYGTAFPDDAAERQLPEASRALLDILVVTAKPVATGTEVELVGRAEPKLIAALRDALDQSS